HEGHSRLSAGQACRVAKMTRRVSDLFHQNSGAAATEFAILVPIMALVTLGILDCWSLASSALAMRAGVSAAATYLIQGGSDDTMTQSLAMAAWSNHPDDAHVTVQRVCSCADTVVACATLCAGTLKPPTAFVHIQATGS